MHRYKRRTLCKSKSQDLGKRPSACTSRKTSVRVHVLVYHAESGSVDENMQLGGAGILIVRLHNQLIGTTFCHQGLVENQGDAVSRLAAAGECGPIGMAVHAVRHYKTGLGQTLANGSLVTRMDGTLPLPRVDMR